MNNEIELNEEQLAEVTGGSFDLTSIRQRATSLTFQNNTVVSPTAVFAVGGGRNSSVEALAQGSENNVGSTSISINSNSL
jgi:hypothetical protein